MIGNDVVDLRDPDARPEHAPRFDARVFCDEELCMLDASANRARRRWQLWAAKEAAYKAAVREDPTTVFSPSRFRVDLLDETADAPTRFEERELRGVVETPLGPLPVSLREEEGAVHALVCSRPGRAVAAATRVAGAGADASAPGREARRFACGRIAEEMSMDVSDLEIRKRGRIPELFVNGRFVAPLSLSHHGEVVAFACEVPA